MYINKRKVHLPTVTVSCLSNCGPGRSGQVTSRVRRRADTRRWRVVSRRVELLTISRHAEISVLFHVWSVSNS